MERFRAQVPSTMPEVAWQETPVRSRIEYLPGSSAIALAASRQPARSSNAQAGHPPPCPAQYTRRRLGLRNFPRSQPLQLAAMPLRSAPVCTPASTYLSPRLSLNSAVSKSPGKSQQTLFNPKSKAKKHIHNSIPRDSNNIRTVHRIGDSIFARRYPCFILNCPAIINLRQIRACSSDG